MLLSHYVDNHWMLLADVFASWLLMADVFTQCGRCKATIFDCVNPQLINCFSCGRCYGHIIIRADVFAKWLMELPHCMG